MVKVAINKCFGGFDLSDEAHERLIELGVEFHKTWDTVKSGKLYVKASNLIHFGKYHSNFSDYENRTNPLLIQVIEELGEKANGRFGQIEIVEIPDDIEWEIDDYDGVETIHGAHRSW